MSTDVLIPHKFLDSADAALAEAFTVHRLYEADDRDAMLAEVAPKIGAIASSGGADRALIEALPNLKLVAHFGVGYDPVDVACCKEHDIRVTNTPDVLNDCVAETTLALMLALCHRVPQSDAYVRAGRWESEGNFGLTDELTGTRAGILGLGRIGKTIAKLCQAFNMEVVYHGRHEQEHQPYPYYADLAEMARAVDWLVVIAPGTEETRGIVSRQVMEALGPRAKLVNMGRGSLVDEDAMIELLESGALGGAALDVFAKEPHVPERLRALENVVLLPHQGSATHKTRAAMGMMVVKNLKAHLRGAPLISPVV